MSEAGARALHVERHRVTTPDGWSLELHRGVRSGDAPGKPVLFVPGFGMNAFIFRYHPRGTSFMASLLDAGLDPWSVDLRGQTSAHARPGARTDIGLADHAFADLPAAFDFVARATGHDRVHAIGCSLGGALLYGYGGTLRDHRIDRLVTMGTPLKWTAPSAVVRGFARLGPLLGVPVRGTRHAARAVLPIVSKLAPRLLSVYLNPALTHVGPARELSRTVEDPHPRVNRQLSRWIRHGDLLLDSVNVTEALRQFDRPLLVIVGSGDRICPPEVALAALEVAGGPTRSLRVGTDAEGVSHADLFIADMAEERIFRPVARFLLGD